MAAPAPGREMDSLPTPAAARSPLEIAETLHKTTGTLPALVRFRTRCGRPACRCAAGEPHGPYWALAWREHGRQRRRYVKPADAPALEAWLAMRRAERAAVRAELAESAALLRALKALYRELDGTGRPGWGRR
jgi:hypothetical protein